MSAEQDPEVEREGPLRAVALRHRREQPGAPRITALGTGECAERILALAQEHDVPVREDRDLVGLLAACELGEEIPEELYAVVAEVLAFLYRLNAEAGEER